MRRIAEWSLRFRLLVLGIAAVIAIASVVVLPHAPLDAVPEFTPPYVEIQTEALGLSAVEVEELITVPLEADLLNGVAWLDSIESESIAGLSSIVLVFEPGTDVLRARQVVAERLTQAHALPQVSKPPAMLQPLASTSRVSMVALTSDDLSLIDMSVLARWTIRPRLMGVPGVANVSVWGQRERQLQVQVDPARLNDAGVTLQQVIETTGNSLWVSPLSFLNASTPGTGGFIDTPNQRLGIHHVSPITSAEDLARVSLEADDIQDEPSGIRLGDVATVVEDHQPLIGDATVNDGRGLLLVIEKFPGANTLDVTDGIEQALDALRPGLTGIEIDSTIYRPATFIESAVGNLALALLAGLALVGIALVVFLRDWRAALISMVSIVLSYLAAGLVLTVSGTTINAMVVAGLALAMGLVVDEAVVSVEAIGRRLRHPREGDADRTRTAIIIDEAVAARSAVVYATLVVLLAIVPLFFIGGAGGAFLPPLITAYLLAALVGLVVGITAGIALATIMPPSDRPSAWSPPFVSWLQDRYDRAWVRLMAIPRSATMSVAVVLLGVIGLATFNMFPQIGEAVTPTFKERDVILHWDAAPGTSGSEMNRMVDQASRELREIAGVRNVGGHTGRAILSDQTAGISSAELWVSLEADAPYDATLDRVQSVAAGYPGLEPNVQTYASNRMREVLSGGEDVVVRVYGIDFATLEAKADEVRELMAGVEGLADARVIPMVEEPTIEVEVDLTAAEAYGIKSGDVRRAAATLLSGIEVGSLFEDQKVFEVVVWGVPELRQSLAAVEGLLIDRPNGGQIQLGEVADVRIASAPAVIARHAVARYLDVAADLNGRDAASVVGDLERRLGNVEFALEYRAEIVGDALPREAEQLRLLAIVGAVLIGIFLLLQAAVQSWKLAALAFLALPAATAGGIAAGLVTGQLLSLGALVGLLAVLGIAARNGLALMMRYRRLEQERGKIPGPELAQIGAHEAVAPTIMTAAVTALAMAPFVVLGDLAGLEIIRPMAIVILGGLLSSTLVTLFLMPILYLGSGPSSQPEQMPIEVGQPVDAQPVGA